MSKKLICVFAQVIFTNNGDTLQAHTGDGLKQDKIYSSDMIPQMHDGLECYWIEELNAYKACQRFKVVDTAWVDDLLNLINEENLVYL